ncbi:hypothetical protein ACVWZM_004093 [Bradyrhizobium sp. USDA 4501]
MPTEDDFHLRTAPSTNIDGYDMTVEQALALVPREFERTFGLGLTGLDDVPLVRPGIFLDRAPKGCEWYVRHCAPPKNPGPRVRKEPAFDLVVKSPRRALPEAGGGIAVAPRIIRLKAKEPNAARLEALVFLARKQGRTRRATDWPIGPILALRVADVLGRYKADCLALPPGGGEEETSTRQTYIYSIDAFCKALPELEVADVTDAVVARYLACPGDRSRRSRLTDLYTVRRSLKIGLGLLGVPPTYNSHFQIPDPGMLPKTAWTPPEFDRLRAAADGWVFNTDGTPVMIPGPEGLVQLRRFDAWSWEGRKAWRRAIPFLAYTVSRHGRLPITRWVPPEVEPKGRKLRKHDRPWIEATDHGIYYHRDGEVHHDGGKRRGGNKVPAEFEAEVRAWYEADLAEGIEWVFHKRDGSPYAGSKLCRKTFDGIVKDAGIDPDRVPHHLKDLAVDWSDESEMDRDTLAAHADTTARTLGKKYGDPRRKALIETAARQMTQGPWRERGERKANVARLFGEAADRRAAAPTAGRRRRPAEG